MLSTLFVSCEDDVDTNNSIFDTTSPERNDLDKWLLENYIYNYNIEVLYRMVDIEADPNYDLVPADYDKSIALAILIKHLWLEVYDETAGIDFMRTNVPKVLQFIGSPAYKSNGSIVLGTAEGGKKVTLYAVNSINPNNIDISFLNEMYFHTMHHEFAHIFHQKKSYPSKFKDLSDGFYVGDNCFNSENTQKLAHQLGFVTRYSRTSPDEDFVEVYSIYVTSTQAEWDAIVKAGTVEGASGNVIMEKKLAIVREYMNNMWNIDIDAVRTSIARRSKEISEFDLSLPK